MRSGTGKGIKPGIFIELTSLNELGRLTCALERTPIPVFSSGTTGGRILAAQLDISFGSPVFYYVPSDREDEFLAYKNTGGVEEVNFTNSAGNPIYTYSPIIAIKEFPPQLSKGLNTSSRQRIYPVSIELSTLSSLAKISSYRTLFEEPPLPLFMCQVDGKQVMAAFTRMNEYEETSLCFYHYIDTPTVSRFVKYSAQRAGSVAFTDRTDEHGFIYVKVIQLKASHPLIRLAKSD